ncbi:GNAT family N-acetyltransferase [Streptomyces sp. NPDC048290]|uniref:GNAT family N-acetyltransferase n=1 Tax=Streptomyces sp. NPDC048290 TaxID=3155811 RepID=UPI0034188242
MDADRNALTASSPGPRRRPRTGSVGPVVHVVPPGPPVPPGRPVLRPMAADDLPYVVGEHLAHFPEGFFARLGRRYLTAYTRTYLTGRDARAFIAESDGVPVGFLVGVTDPAAHRAHLLAVHGRGLALRACAALCVRPLLALHFVRTRLGRYARALLPGVRPPRPAPATAGPDDGPHAVLAHVVVSADHRSYGLGAALVRRFLDDAAAAGCARVSLVTAAGPGGAGPYYERRGWRRTGEHRTPDGRLLLTYVHDLPLAPPAHASRAPRLPLPRRGTAP